MGKKSQDNALRINNPGKEGELGVEKITEKDLHMDNAAPVKDDLLYIQGN